jgi:signal transduction histidine kinase
MQASAGPFESWILGSLSSGIAAIDRDGRLVVYNAGAQRILGGPPGDPATALGRDCREVLCAQPTVARLLLDALDGRSPLSRAELCLDGAAGRLAGTIGFTLAPVRDGEGAVRGATMLFRDLTPIERGDEQERLRERLAALGQMAAGMAHEIRNPLASMEVLAGLLRRRLGDRPEELSLLAQLTSELRAVAQSLSASLEFVRPVSPVRSPVDVCALVEEALRTAVKRTSFAGRVERRYDEDLPELEADPELLRGVVTNLIVNACEAMAGQGGAGCLVLGVCWGMSDPATRPVRVRGGGFAGAPDAAPVREIAISVSDSGPGVAEELRERIFYPFFTTKQRGSGMGLALAQKVAASHGGVLELADDEGDAAPGATFRLRLPVAAGGGR